jgi:hypothetical protein
MFFKDWGGDNFMGIGYLALLKKIAFTASQKWPFPDQPPWSPSLDMFLGSNLQHSNGHNENHKLGHI